MAQGCSSSANRCVLPEDVAPVIVAQFKGGLHEFSEAPLSRNSTVQPAFFRLFFARPRPYRCTSARLLSKTFSLGTDNCLRSCTRVDWTIEEVSERTGEEYAVVITFLVAYRVCRIFGEENVDRPTGGG